MKFRRVLSLLTALMLACQLPLAALAVEADLYYGDVTITDTDVTHSTATETNKTEAHGGSVTVTQSHSETATSNTVTVTTTSENVTVTLDNVNVALPSGNVEQSNPVDVNAAEGTTVTIELDGKNKLDASTGTHENNGSAALHKGESGNLVIQDSDNDGGSLTAIGNVYAAGIGSNSSYSGEDTANITINSGTVVAESKSPYDYQYSSGAGIGGGSNGGAENIVINGGTVTASSEKGAGIGGGGNGTAENITITGGTVTATSDQGAGIGGGAGNNTSSSTGDEATATNINISGGTVTATSNTGAGIGGGSGKGRGEDITISDDADVTASSDQGAGIGGGKNGSGSGITIENGTVTATSNSGAGIGGGANTGGTGTDIVIEDGTVTATSNTGAAIGSGENAMHFNKPLDIEINGGDVTATSTDGAAIGGGKSATYYGSAENKVINIEITDGTVEATSTNGAAIGAGSGFSKPTTNVTVSGDAEVTATSTNGSAFGTDKEGNDFVPDVSELNGEVTANQGGETIIYPLPEPPAEEIPTAPEAGAGEESAASEAEEEGTAVYAAAAVTGEEDSIFSVKESGETEMEGTEEVKGTVLYVEAEGSHITFTVKLSALKALADKGIKTVVFITDEGVAAYSLAAILEALEGAEDLIVTIDGETVTLHYGDEEKSELLLEKAEVEKLVEAR